MGHVWVPHSVNIEQICRHCVADIKGELADFRRRQGNIT